MISQEQIDYATALLTSDGVQHIFSRIEDACVAEWKAASPTDLATQQKCHAMMMALQALRSEIVAISNSNKVSNFNASLATKSKLRY